MQELKKEETASRTHNYFSLKMQLPKTSIYKQYTEISPHSVHEKVLIDSRHIYNYQIVQKFYELKKEKKKNQ